MATAMARDPEAVRRFLAESLATDRQGGRLLKKIGSNGHCGTQGTAERVRRVYAMPADLPSIAWTEPFPERVLAKRPGPLSSSSSAPNLKYQTFDTSRTKLNLKHNRLFEVPFPSLLFQQRSFERESI
ncbi:unnamed protein product [Durusdinium trenchii]|uniref:Uncharacterized protein n=2 Tax=Durusdinium trenchii TaxID=1381693 RepID=A0ABP0QA39_9DINO